MPWFGVELTTTGKPSAVALGESLRAMGGTAEQGQPSGGVVLPDLAPLNSLTKMPEPSPNCLCSKELGIAAKRKARYRIRQDIPAVLCLEIR